MYNTRYQLKLYRSTGFKNHYLNIVLVAHVFDRIFLNNGLPVSCSVVGTEEGLELEKMQNASLLPTDQYTARLIRDANGTPTEYDRQNGIQVNIFHFQQLNKEKKHFTRDIIPDINYQTGYTLAHETLHRLLDQIELYYDLDGLNPFGLTTGGAAGYCKHTIEDWNLLQPGVDSRGHNNYMGIPVSASSHYATKMETILPFQKRMINRLFQNISMDAKSKDFADFWRATRAELLNKVKS